MAPSPNIPEEIGAYFPRQTSFHISETSYLQILAFSAGQRASLILSSPHRGRLGARRFRTCKTCRMSMAQRRRIHPISSG